MTTRASVLCAAALAAALIVPATAGAQAREVWKSADGGTTLEAGAFYKTVETALRNQFGLVQGTEALQQLFDRIRLAHTELNLPQVLSRPETGVTSGNTGRVWGRLLVNNRVEFSAGWQLDAVLASNRTLTGSAGLGGSVPVGASQAASRRLVDFNATLVDRGTFLLKQNLDLLSVKIALPKGELVVGRQVLSWGTGRLWNPTDLLSPFAPTDIDREVRHGVDAVRYSMPLGKTSFVDVLYLPQRKGWAQGGVARVQANVKRFDVSVSAAKYVSDVVFGADTAGDIGPVNVHAEAAYTLGLANLGEPGPVKVGERFLRGAVGFDWRPAKDWTLGAEYYFNGFGAARPADYASKLQSSRVTRGEVYGAGRHYLGMSVGRKATDLLSVQMLVVTNVTDPSALAIPVAEYWAAQHVLVRIGGYVPLGSRPDAGRLQSLTVSDVLTGSPAYLSATSSLGLRSEYGAAPWGAFVQVGVHF